MRFIFYKKLPRELFYKSLGHVTSQFEILEIMPIKMLYKYRFLILYMICTSLFTSGKIIPDRPKGHTAVFIFVLSNLFIWKPIIQKPEKKYLVVYKMAWIRQLWFEFTIHIMGSFRSEIINPRPLKCSENKLPHAPRENDYQAVCI